VGRLEGREKVAGAGVQNPSTQDKSKNDAKYQREKDGRPRGGTTVCRAEAPEVRGNSNTKELYPLEDSSYHFHHSAGDCSSEIILTHSIYTYR
jgi:hypothetical protein